MEMKRQSGIELLRIIMLVQIVFLHISAYGGYEDMAMKLEGRQELVYLMQWLMCRCPVPTLFMLTGYFMAEKNIEIKPNLKKCLRVNGTMTFYSLAALIFCMIALSAGWSIEGLPKEIDGFDIARAFLPFFDSTWFFMTNYLIVMLLSPFINILLSQLDFKKYTLLTGILFFILSIWTNLSRIENVYEFFNLGKVVVNDEGKSLYMAVFLYILGGYVRKFIKEKEGVRILPLIGFFALWLLNLLLTCNFEWYESVYERSDNPIVIIQCVLLILFFRSLHFSSNIINMISRSNIAVYLIHENPYVRSILWEQFPYLKSPEFYQQSVMVYLSVIWGICIGVYVACNLINQFRLGVVWLFKSPFSAKGSDSA